MPHHRHTTIARLLKRRLTILLQQYCFVSGISCQLSPNALGTVTILLRLGHFRPDCSRLHHSSSRRRCTGGSRCSLPTEDRSGCGGTRHASSPLSYKTSMTFHMRASDLLPCPAQCLSLPGLFLARFSARATAQQDAPTCTVRSGQYVHSGSKVSRALQTSCCV